MGFSSITGQETIMFADNASFDGTERTGKLATNGQIWIGSTAVNAGGTHINVGTLTSTNSTLTIGFTSPNITLDLPNGLAAIQTLTGSSGGALSPTSGNFNLLGTGSITTVGSGSTITTRLTGLTANAVLVGAGTPTITSLAVGTTGQLLIGATGADPAFGSTANADFTFGAANSGATRTFTVTNTSNAASSKSLIVNSVGGTSSDDAVYQAVVTGTTTWSWGVDNSDSDAFVIAASSALGTTNVMRVATTGEINYPLQTAFLATSSGDTLNVTGDSTTFTCIFDTEIFDQNSDYNNSTYTFTAPVTGRYQLSSMVSTFGNTSSVTSTGVQMVTSNRTYQYGAKQDLALTFNGSAILGRTITMLCDMDAADTATITWQAVGTTKTIDYGGGSFFGGYLVC